MLVSTLRQLDRSVGTFLCLVLTLFCRLFEKMETRLPAKPKRILFIKLAEQGSTVLAYPALRRAGEMVGADRVYFLCFDDNRFILDAMSVLPADNVITVSHKNLFAAAASGLAALRRLRQTGIDAAIDFEFFARFSAVLAYLSGARWRVGFHSYFGEASYRGDLMTHRLLFNPYLHISETFQSMVEALNHAPAELPTFPARCQGPVVQPRFDASPDEAAEVARIVESASGDRRISPLVLMNPNASDLLPLRRWPSANYVALARRLLVRYPELRIGYTGASNESIATEQLVREVGSKRCFSLAGKTTLKQLLVLYCLGEVLVTNDSGPAHFATLTPIDVVTLFGPETPLLFAARTPLSHAIWAGIACSPCVSAYNGRQSACRNNLCMQLITVDQVFEKVCTLLDRRPALRERHRDS